MRRQAIVLDVITCCAVVGPLASAGRTSFTSDAAPCHRTGCGHLQCYYQRLRKCQQHQQTLHIVRAMQRQPSAAPAGLTSFMSDAAPCHRVGCAHAHVQTSARAKTASSPAGLLRVAQHVAPLLCFRVTFHVPATPLCRALGPVASAGLTSFTSDAKTRHRAGCDHPLCSCRRPDILYERCEDMPSYRM